MLIPILLLFQKPSTGVERFHQFFQRTKSFSVAISTVSNQIPLPGKGSLIVVKPDQFRFSMQWGQYDYTLVKARTELLEFAHSVKLYQITAEQPGLVANSSVFPLMRSEGVLGALLNGNLRGEIPTNAQFRTQDNKNGLETLVATWSGGMSSGKAVAKVTADGRLTHFDFSEDSPTGSLRRTYEFSNYVINPPSYSGTFSTEPPTGFVSYQLPEVWGPFDLGAQLRLGPWRSASGAKNIDDLCKGKLLLVTDGESKPAAGLIQFLASQKLPVETMVLSLGASGGAYSSPAPSVKAALGSMGLPLMILMDSQGRVKWMKVGFDADNTSAIVPEITKAVQGKIDR